MDMHAAVEKNWLQNTKPTSANETKLTHLDVWVRDKNGKLIEETETLKVGTDGSASPFWLNWVKKKFSIPRKGGKPSRSTNFELMEPLYIVPITEVDRLLTALEECVDLVNLDNGGDYLMLSKTAPDPLYYMLVCQYATDVKDLHRLMQPTDVHRSVWHLQNLYTCQRLGCMDGQGRIQSCQQTKFNSGLYFQRHPNNGQVLRWHRKGIRKDFQRERKWKWTQQTDYSLEKAKGAGSF